MIVLLIVLNIIPKITTGCPKKSIPPNPKQAVCFTESQFFFGPKLHLRMEFDSGVGPTCKGQLKKTKKQAGAELCQSQIGYKL